jgi:hypothetical protein
MNKLPPAELEERSKLVHLIGEQLRDLQAKNSGSQDIDEKAVRPLALVPFVIISLVLIILFLVASHFI